MEFTKKEKQTFTGERALFQGKNLEISDCVFEDGESPLKESKNINLKNSSFRWKYPLWYSENLNLKNCTLTETARAGIWYTKNITIRDTLIAAPKTFRRAEGVTLENIDIPDAQETFWHCKKINLKNVTANGTYFALDSEDIICENLKLTGGYCFDGVKNAVIRNAEINTKDAFWNSKNVTVYDSYISGEYLGWNAENLTLINCTIESLQGMCYIKNLKLVNCKLINTTLAFEYSTVDADICGGVDSILNPSGGRITAGHIDKLIIEPDKVDPEKTVIECTEAA